MEMKNKNVQPVSEATLKIGDSTLLIDSISSRMWFNEELNKDIITSKIFCTSSYPITDESKLKDNKIVFLNIQSVAETGKHVIQDINDDWINHIGYDFTKTSTYYGYDPEGKKHWIQIHELDKEKKIIAFEVHLKEYLSLEQRMAKVEPREVVFEGKNIPFTIFK
jgi:hypothetical protein